MSNAVLYVAASTTNRRPRGFGKPCRVSSCSFGRCIRITNSKLRRLSVKDWR